MDEPAYASREPRYEGEDTSLTTKQELRGWYCYGIAAEVFAVCGSGSFLPVTLEQLARENGVLWSDRTRPCIEPVATSKLMARAVQENDQCIINLFGSDITTAAFAMYTFSLAVVVQALTLISLGSTADHGDNKKRLLLFFAFSGAITSMMFLFVSPSMYLLAPVLCVIGITTCGCGFVMQNSFLPLLAANHPTAATFNKSQHVLDSPSSPTIPQSLTPELQISNRISANGMGLGYGAAVLVQIFSILVLFVTGKMTTSTTLPLRIVLFIVGVWWFVFTIPAAWWLRKRPGPPLLHTKTSLYQSQTTTTLNQIWMYVKDAWSTLLRTLSLAIRLKQMRLFLVAWFILSDAVATAGGTAILFARTELKLSTVGIGLLSITATMAGIAGSILWPIFSRRFNLKSSRTIMACMLLLEIVPLYGLLGYLPFIQRLGFIGLQQAWEIYPLAVVHGLVMGGLTSYCRSFFGQLIPPGQEVAFYALFAITDKGSSAIGPAVVGRIVDVSGGIRPAFWFLAVLNILPIPFILWCNEAKGIEEAKTVGLGGDQDGSYGRLRLSSDHLDLSPDLDRGEGLRLMIDRDRD